MPTHVVTTRVPPYVHEHLHELAERRGQSLAATAAGLLAAALEDPAATAAARDGALVDAVRTVLADVDDPTAAMYRELAVALARAVERREAGYIAAAATLRKVVDDACAAQRQADHPDGDPLMAGLLAGLHF